MDMYANIMKEFANRRKMLARRTGNINNTICGTALFVHPKKVTNDCEDAFPPSRTESDAVDKNLNFTYLPRYRRDCARQKY